MGNTVIVRGGSVESLASGNVFGCGRPAAATTAYQDGVCPLPKQLDEKVEELHFPAHGAVLAAVFAQNVVYLKPKDHDEKVNSTFLHAVRSSLPLLSLLRCQS